MLRQVAKRAFCLSVVCFLVSACWKQSSLEDETPEEADTSDTSAESADLELLWVRQIGGDEVLGVLDISGYERVTDVGLLPDGSVMILGLFKGEAGFGEGESGAVTLTSEGGLDFFVARYDSEGRLDWVTRGGGPSTESTGGLAVHPEGGVIASVSCGEEMTFSDPNAPLLEVEADTWPACLVRFTDAGEIAWISTAGAEWDWGLIQPVTITAEGDIIIAAFLDKFAVFGAGQPNETAVEINEGDYLDLVAAFGPGGDFRWLRALHDIDNQTENGLITLDITTTPNDTLLLTGFYFGRPLVGAGTTAETRLGFSDDSESPFIAELTLDGELIHVVQGKSDAAGAWSLALLQDGDIAVTGTFDEKLVLDPGGANEILFESPLNEDTGFYYGNSFVARYSPSLDLAFALGVDGEKSHGGDKVLALPTGGFLVLGTFETTVSFGPYTVSSMSEKTTPDGEVYITAFDTADSTAWLTMIGATGEIDVSDAAVWDGQYLYVVGRFSDSVSFGGINGAEALSSRGDSDAYLAKYRLPSL